MRRALLASLLGLFAACTSAPKPPPAVVAPAPDPAQERAALLEGCSAARVAERGWMLTCGPLMASVNTGEALSPEISLATQLSAFRASVKGRVDEVAQPLPVAGESAPSVRVTVRSSDEGARLLFRGRFAAVALPDRQVRVISCGTRNTSDDLARCERLLRLLAAEGVPAEVKRRVVSPRTPTLFGRPLAVPTGCSVVMEDDEAVRIVCADAEFSWSVVREAAHTDALLDELVKSVRARTAAGVSENRAPCTIEGTATTCRRLTIAANDPASSVTGYVGTAQVKGKTIVARCTYAERGGALPEVCNEVIRVK